MVLSLSQSDVARLLANPSTQVRADVAGKLAQELDNPQLSESELRMAQDVIRLMARDVEATVRRTLSQGLRHSTRLPHDVAVRFARDVEAVALPTLLSSEVLTDDDLIEVIAGNSVLKQETIANRANVSETVSDALIVGAHGDAVSTLMRNQGARITEASLNAAVDRFPDNDAVKDGMARREVLPIRVAERLVALVSHQLKTYLVSHHELPTALATDIVLQAREQATLQLSSFCGDDDLEQLALQMHRSGRLTPFLVLRALCLGHMEFVEAAMAAMTNVPVANVRLLIHDAGPNGLRSLLERSGLPARLFPAVRVAVDVVKSTRFDGEAHDLERYRARVIARILTQFENFNQDDLDYLLDKLGDVLTPAAADPADAAHLPDRPPTGARHRLRTPRPTGMTRHTERHGHRLI